MENVNGVVVMDIAVVKMVGKEMDAMVLLVEKPNIHVYFSQVLKLLL